MPTPSILAGTWKLKNIQVVTQTAFAMPRQVTSVFAEREDGIDYTSDVVYGDGRSTRIESSFRVDGQTYPLTGSPVGDAWSLKQTGPASFEGAITRDGQPSGRVRATVSPDGKLLTTEWEIVQAEGPTIFYRTQADRQP